MTLLIEVDLTVRNPDVTIDDAYDLVMKSCGTSEKNTRETPATKLNAGLTVANEGKGFRWLCSRSILRPPLMSSRADRTDE